MAGIFGPDYGKAGVGISKNGPAKGRVKLFFEILGVRVWKLFVLNLIYVLACIPIITIGPATAAMTKVLKNYSIDKNAYVWLDFKETFIKNFGRAMLVGIVDIIAYAGIASGFYIYTTLAMDPNVGGTVYYVLFVVTLSVAIAFTVMNYYVYLMLVSTDLSLKNIVKNAVALTFLAPKQNFISVAANIVLPVIFGLLVLVNFQFVVALPFMPASFIGFIVCYCCYPVVQKYVINPYYESRGEENPEAPKKYDNGGEVLFEDMGGKEKPLNPKKKKGKGKIIS